MAWIEKRKAPRVPVALNIEESDGLKVLGFGYVKDLSTHGMAIEAQALEAPLPKVGSFVRVRFKTPHSPKVITAAGRVIRIEEKEPPRIGLEFKDLEQEFKNEIERFIQSQMSTRL